MTPDPRDAYLTVAAPVQVATEVRRSRFVCHLHPVGTDEAARQVLADIRPAAMPGTTAALGFSAPRP